MKRWFALQTEEERFFNDTASAVCGCALRGNAAKSNRRDQRPERFHDLLGDEGRDFEQDCPTERSRFEWNSTRWCESSRFTKGTFVTKCGWNLACERHCQRIRSQLELDVKLAEMESATQGKLAVAKGQEQASLETDVNHDLARNLD